MLIFRFVFVLIGVGIILYSIFSFFSEVRKRNGDTLIVTGRVINVVSCNCNPVVEYKIEGEAYKVQAIGDSCDTILSLPKVGDKADVEYFADYPENARGLTVYSDGLIHDNDFF